MTEGEKEGETLRDFLINVINLTIKRKRDEAKGKGEKKIEKITATNR